MRTKIMMALTLLVLVILNYGIYEKENIKKSGETVLLELAPADSRFLLQGDYMYLRYAIEKDAYDTYEALDAAESDRIQNRGYMVIQPDDKNIAKFIRFYEGEDLATREMLLRFHRSYLHPSYKSIRIVPDSFLLQEGHAEKYEEAEYGVFKFDNSGDYLFFHLADENGKIINPDED